MEVIQEVQKCCRAFLENKMSDANRQTTALLNSVWNSITADIAKSRNISVAKLNRNC
jgi:protease-4